MKKLFYAAVLVGMTMAAHAEIKVGIIGLDTSHSLAFAKLMNVKRDTPLLREFRVTDACPWGSLDIVTSTNRIPSYSKRVSAMGVNLSQSVAGVLKNVDVVFLETNDGSRHYEQALEVFKSGKPVFIDKPIAHTLVDAVRICDAAKKYNVRFFSASSLRFIPEVCRIRDGAYGNVLGADTIAPGNFEPKHIGLGWYGVHAVEPLFALMGRGVKTVTAVRTKKTMIATGVWNDGRVGVARAMSATPGYGGVAFCERKRVDIGDYNGYETLLKLVLGFFKDASAAPVVDPDETLEIFAFMEAADESVRRGGAAVSVADVLARARAAAAAL